MTAGVVIGPVGAGERAAWEALWRAYLDFYDTSLAADIYEATWRRLQDPNEPMGVLGAYVDGRLCGIAHYVYHRSCWTIGDYCYLQDLFVASHARGRGLGRALRPGRAGCIGSRRRATPPPARFTTRWPSARVSSSTASCSE